MAGELAGIEPTRVLQDREHRVSPLRRHAGVLEGWQVVDTGLHVAQQIGRLQALPLGPSDLPAPVTQVALQRRSGGQSFAHGRFNQGSGRAFAVRSRPIRTA